MRNILSILCIIVPFCCFSQLFDDFSTNASLSDKWAGNTEHFIVNKEKQLQLYHINNADKSHLSTTFTHQAQLVWEFKANLSLNPSRYNYAQIYLSADTPLLSETKKGYYILLGGTNDEISLYYQNEGDSFALISGIKRLDNSRNEIHVKVIKSPENRWELHSKVNSEPTWQLEGFAQEKISPSGNHFGVVCTYTKTYADKFSFDYFAITSSGYSPEDEDPDSKPEIEEEAEINYGDIVITEIMANPKGYLYIPETEYIELFNRTNRDLNLSGCKYVYDQKVFVLPDYRLLANQHVILAHQNQLHQIPEEVPHIGISSFPTIANTGKLLSLENSKGSLIHMVEFSDKWYQNSSKNKGGYSLEAIDPHNLYASIHNWIASEDPTGGTPGRTNSVDSDNPDQIQPLLIRHALLDSVRLEIEFSKPMHQELSQCPNWIELPHHWSGYNIKANHPRNTKFEIEATHLGTTNYHELQLKAPRCISGHEMHPRGLLWFGASEEVIEGELLFNEILFNPDSGTSSFIEIINNSDKIIDLSTLQLATLATNLAISASYPICLESSLFSPGEYAVIAVDPYSVFTQYGLSGKPLTITIPKLSLSKTKGIIALIDAQNQIIDQINYGHAMHTSSQKDLTGISLERVSLLQASSDPMNWRSALSSERYATPGNKNSVSIGDTDTSIGDQNLNNRKFWLPNKRVNINASGADRELIIHYTLDSPNYRCAIRLFDMRGIQIAQLASNQELAEAGELNFGENWLTPLSQSHGIYILLIDYYDTNGKGGKLKLPFPITP